MTKRDEAIEKKLSAIEAAVKLLQVQKPADNVWKVSYS